MVDGVDWWIKHRFYWEIKPYGDKDGLKIKICTNGYKLMKGLKYAEYSQT